MQREPNRGRGRHSRLVQRGSGYRFKVANPRRGQVRPDGKTEPPQIWVSVPPEFCTSEQDAYRWMLRELGKGEPQERTSYSNKTILEYAIQALTIGKPRLKQSTRERYLERIKSERLRRIHPLHVSRVTAADIIRLVIEPMLEEGLAGNTINGILTPLSVVFDVAVNVDQVRTDNPILVAKKRIELPARRIRPRIRVITEEHLVRLLDASLGRYRAIFAVAGYVGARVGEILGLRWQDIDFDGLTITFSHQAHPQTGELIFGLKTDKQNQAGGRVVDMPVKLVSYLKEQQRRCGLNRRPTDRVFPDICQSSLRGYIIRLREKLGPPFDGADGNMPLSMHKLRHSYGSRMITKNMPISYIAAQMGDTSLTLLRTYTHEIDRRDSAENRELLNRVFG